MSGTQAEMPGGLANAPPTGCQHVQDLPDDRIVSTVAPPDLEPSIGPDALGEQVTRRVLLKVDRAPDVEGNCLPQPANGSDLVDVLRTVVGGGDGDPGGAVSQANCGTRLVAFLSSGPAGPIMIHVALAHQGSIFQSQERLRQVVRFAYHLEEFTSGGSSPPIGLGISLVRARSVPARGPKYPQPPAGGRGRPTFAFLPR